ncbi:replication-relaxation family protein [Desertibacillus haloalkaliphilus]|uniref:replication-relaxation family protein n=1 Tax=Desertibacillus haloalkaliphilus TaxID=1328930 RepID=UPI001C26692D|nr:replication-relaxation family protein [Desertibacillus haloalkaliphilus]
MNGGKVHPKRYDPITTTEEVIRMMKRRLLSEEDFQILKVLGDAICANENQMKRYMTSQLSYSKVTNRLNRMREKGLVERWLVKSDLHEEKHPAPFTLGIAGFKILKHYYSHMFFMLPDKWERLGLRTVQRYVAANEIRCQLAEKMILKNWKWNAVMNHNPMLTKLFGVGEVDTPQGVLNFAFERVQTGRDFKRFLTNKFQMWKAVHEQYGNLPINGLEKNPTVVVVFASTLTLAEHVQKTLLLDLLPFHTLVCVEEDIWSRGIANSFYAPKKGGLTPVRMSFME